GHSRGAFTGAQRPRAGLFREADGGTILLDEIGELALVAQAKLLRVLQEGEVRPVGEDRVQKVDVRVIAATHRDLRELSAQGKFREDLFYRLNVIHLHVPPLRERPEDIPVLARYFLGRYEQRFGIRPLKAPAEFMDRLMQHSWPGNVRELENAIEGVVALSMDGEVDVSLLPRAAPSAVAAGAPSQDPRASLKERLDAYERGLIVAALEEAGGNRTHAARALGLNRGTLHSKLNKYGLATAEDAEDDPAADL